MQNYKTQDFDELYRQARKKVEARLGFILHSGVWLFTLVLTFIASNRFGQLHGDALVFLAGWTFGLAMHFLVVRQYFNRPDFPKLANKPRKSIVERMIEQELKAQGLDEEQIRSRWPEPR